MNDYVIKNILKMIELTNQTITLPMISICPSHGFWLGLIIGIIGTIGLWFVLKIMVSYKIL